MTYSSQLDVRITDSTLRDGSHAVRHQFDVTQVRAVVGALASAHVPVIEVAHGDGLGGSSFNYGFSGTDPLELIEAAVAAAGDSRIACLLVPGVGTVADLRPAATAGVSVARIATHCTEADVSPQHFGAARDLGMETVGFLMLSHMAAPGDLAVQARIMVDAGCQCVYVVDSAGALLPDGVTARVEALVQALGDDAQVGFHAHNNLGCGIANSLAAHAAGAVQIDGSTRGLGAGAGNAATELIATVFERQGITTGIDALAVIDAAEDVVAPMIDHTPIPDRDSIMLGYAGTYSSFLLHAHRASERYGVPAPQILLEAGRRGYVGGQEDMLIDIAVALAERGQPVEA
jgi:4-hydroxy 2-oxovalerate aldolase